MSDESRHERELGGQLLASVSRSFYLTLKALPGELREPISLAYLLARTADTIADTAAVPVELRLAGLAQFDQAVKGLPTPGLARLVRESFLPHQTDAAESRLMEHFSDGLAWLATMREVPLRAIREVLQHIIEGQRLDLERFPGDGRLRCLADDAELDDYTWRVAGCVGEFWTGLCATEKPGALDPAVPLEQMKLWGADFGRGLQLVNILRDIGEDLRDGRGYLPGTVVEGRLAEIALQAAWRHWAAACRLHLEAGLQYVRHVADGKLRYATALPLLLAARTLALLRAAPWEELKHGVKVSRLEVARLLAEAALACRHPDSLERLFRRLAGEA